MASIPNSILKLAEEWHATIDFDPEFTGTRRQVYDGISQITFSLAHPTFSNPHSSNRERIDSVIASIIPLLVDHAAKLPPDRNNPNGVRNYISDITKLLDLRGNEKIASLSQTIEQLRRKSESLSPRSEREIKDLIKAKGELLQLKAIVDFSSEVEILTNSQPSNLPTIKKEDKERVDALDRKTQQLSQFKLLSNPAARKLYTIANEKLHELQLRKPEKKFPLIKRAESKHPPRTSMSEHLPMEFVIEIWDPFNEPLKKLTDKVSDVSFSILKKALSPIRIFFSQPLYAFYQKIRPF